MISDQLKDTLFEQIIKELIGEGTDGLKPVLELLLNAAMKVEREQFLGAGPHERCEERKGYANGYKHKGFQTRLGALDLEIPQVRGLGILSSESGKRFPLREGSEASNRADVPRRSIDTESARHHGKVVWL